MTTLLAVPVRPVPAAVRPAAVPLGPNWFATVMGTGIVATASTTLPVAVPGLRTAATAVWVLAAALLVVLTVAFTAQLARTRRTYADDPVLVHFWGAPPMALVTVGAGALLLGRDLIGVPAAVAVDAVLWGAGTLLGLGVAVAVPYRMLTSPGAGPAFAGRLMPVVPPMVSAATGALLVPYLPAGQPRLTLLLCCGAMFGVSLIAAVLVLAQLWGWLVTHGAGPAALVPTLWIVLGPLGQSVTAAHLLARASGGVLPAPYAEGAQVAALLFGVPVLGFALVWMALAGAVTVRTARTGLPFSMAWWSFTFPVGTVATGAAAVAARTGSAVVGALSVLLYAGLVAAWVVVAVRTARTLSRS